MKKYLFMIIAIAITSCNASNNTPSKEEYYFDIDCVEDIISYEINPYEYAYIVYYYDPDGLYCEETNEALNLYIEETDLFIEFLIDYNNYIDTSENIHNSSLEIGKKWHVIYEDSTYYLRMKL
jgi:hypothetical protein